MKRLLYTFLISMFLTGCAAVPVMFPDEALEAEKVEPTKFKRPFPEPESGQPIVVAVYQFMDKTGQRKDSATIAKLSSAVTQGAESLLLKALADVGDGQWFRIVERVGLENLLKERQLIRSAREEMKDSLNLRPILFAGMIIEGAIVSYDTNKRTGGFGWRYLGIGPSTQYQEDMVTVSLRAVNVQTGEVILTVNTQKTILSVATSISTFKFFDSGTRAFENEIGSTSTEPGIYAVKAAIDLAVEELIYQGERKNLWKFKQIKTEEE
jgi:curli production assembly/transport component CsgG